jgi:hypothetical protein
MGFEQLAKLRDELAKQAKAQRQQKQAADKHAAHPGGKDAKAKDAKARDPKNRDAKARDAKPSAAPAAKAAGKPASARPAQKPQNPVDPVVHTIGKLQKRFPLAFPKNPAPKVALKIGILEDLLAQAAELKLTEQEVRDAVSTWCRGSRYWAHPYGEFNLVVPLNEGAALAGPNGWCYGGWTAPAPGSHHFPEAKGGAVIALFFLPSGRIAYDVKPPVQ